MQSLLDQAKHNQEFLDALEDKFPNQYNDWKITILFYIAIHLVKALAELLGRDIGESHEKINDNINPNSSKRPVMPFSRTAYLNYKQLYRDSQTARYDGMSIDVEAFEKLKRKDYEVCLRRLVDLKKYLRDRGLPIEV